MFNDYIVEVKYGVDRNGKPVYCCVHKWITKTVIVRAESEMGAKQRAAHQIADELGVKWSSFTCSTKASKR